MRTIRRWIERRRAERRNAPRRDAVAARLAETLGHPVRLRPGGARGRDAIYLVESAGAQPGVVGVLRLANPWLRRAQLPPDSPFRWLDDEARFAREWAAYAAGAGHGLTPAPIWREEGAMLCAFVDGVRLSRRLAADPARFWALACATSTTLAELHRIGLTHMDACFANTLEVAGAPRHVLVDFEYGPAPDLSPAQQRAYDHLRVVESSLKFLPADRRDAFAPWIETLDACADADARAADVARLRPALGRLWAHAALRAALARIFPALAG